jgi:hypothetical protein
MTIKIKRTIKITRRRTRRGDVCPQRGASAGPTWQIRREDYRVF